MFKMGKKGHNIWKFWQKCTKSEFSFGKKDRGLHVIFDKLLEKALLLKIMKNAFDFTLKVLFILKILKFLTT